MNQDKLGDLFIAPKPDHFNRIWDAIVIGAGPAGAVCALWLAKGGADVALVESTSFPREKICGDGLIADSLQALDRAGLLNLVKGHAHSSSTVRLYSPSRIHNDVPGEFLTLRRQQLDSILAWGAKREGAIGVLGKAVELRKVEKGVEVNLEYSEKPLVGQVCVVATGARVNLGRAFGLVTDSAPSAMAVRQYIRSTHETDRLIISFDQSILPGYGWIFPMGEGWYNVGCGAARRPGTSFDLNLRRAYEQFLKNFPPARSLAQAQQEATSLRGAPLRCGLTGSRFFAPGPILGVGEVVGSTFPFSGEGIGKAMETGEIAAELILDSLKRKDLDSLSVYPAEIQRRLADRYIGYKIAENWLSKSWLADLIARRSQKSPYLQEQLAGIVNETVDPSAVFSVQGILRSFIKGARGR